MLTQTQTDTLRKMLTYRRPHGSRTVDVFVREYLEDLPGAYADHTGNVHVAIGASRVLFSSHVDTVHRTGGIQRVDLTRDGILQRKADATDCLGADDTAGVFIMREMIGARIPGHYIFHRGEEVGGIGSGAIAYLDRDWLVTHFDAAIAFDRRGTRDVITHQMGSRTASNAFARSLAGILNASAGLKYRRAQGVYTDTAEYAEYIPECTNLSVGYQNEHSSSEILDTWHVGRLLFAMLHFDESKLTISRVPMPWSAGPSSSNVVPIRSKAPHETGQTNVYIDGARARTYLPDDADDYPIRPRIIDGVCELCEWPQHMCKCTDEDRAFWKYLNGYK